MHARANAGRIRCASSSRNASGSRGAGIRRMSRTSRIPRTSRALGRRSEGRPTRGALCTRLAGSPHPARRRSGSSARSSPDGGVRSPRRRKGACTRAARKQGRAGARRRDRLRRRAMPPAAPAAGRGPWAPTAASGSSVPHGANSSAYLRSASPATSREPAAAAHSSSAAASARTTRSASRAADARIGHGEPHGIHLFAHGVGHHQHRAAHARVPRAPRHRVERRHAHQGHAERRRHALSRGQRNAHAGERSRAAPAHDARDLALLDALRSQGRVDARQQLRVGCAARLHLQGQHYVHRGGVFARHALRQQSSQAQGDHLVGRVEREHVRRRAGMPAFRGLKGRWDVVCHSECLFYE